jgi:hypothetical protein
MQPFESDTDPVRRAFLSSLDKLLWEFGRGEDGSVPEDLAQGPVPGGNSSALPETVPTSAELYIETPNDVRNASPGRKPVLQQSEAREGTDDGESCDSSEESLFALEAPAARALKEKRAENLSASSTPLSVLSPTSPRGSRGFSRGLEEREGSRGSRRGLEEREGSRGVNRDLEERGGSRGSRRGLEEREVSRGVNRGLEGRDGADEGRVELTQVDSCASVAGAAAAGHVSVRVDSSQRRSGRRDGAQAEVGLPARSGSEKRAVSGSRKTGGSDINWAKGKNGVGNDAEILERIRQLVVSGGALSTSPKQRKKGDRAKPPKDDSDAAPSERVGSRKSVAIQANSSPSSNPDDQNPQTSSKARSRARPPPEDGEFERSSGEMYSSGDDSAGARASLIPEYVRKDVPTFKRRVRKAHHGASARGARAATTQTEEEGFVRKTAVERLVESVKEEKGKSEEEDVGRDREEFQEDAVYVQVSKPEGHGVFLIKPLGL